MTSNEWNKAHPEKIKLAWEKYAQKNRESGKRVASNHNKCIECGLSFDKETSIVLGHKQISRFRVLCKDCQ